MTALPERFDPVFLRIAVAGPGDWPDSWDWSHLIEFREFVDEHRAELLREAKRAADWYEFIFLHDRPARPGALMEIRAAIKHDAEYWSRVRDVWEDAEIPSEAESLWRDLLTAPRARREAMMHDGGDWDEPWLLSLLPDPVPVFRGFNGPDDDDGQGFSWTTDRVKAEWFARRLGRVREGWPRIAVGTVDKANVIAYLLERDEDEVLVLPEDVRGVRVDEVSDPLREPEPVGATA